MYEDRCTMYVSQRLDYQYIAKHCSSVYLGFTTYTRYDVRGMILFSLYINLEK
jgi:hypothetical protein